jgi:tetratricopeptide (TPR) repeat protein
MTGAEASGAKPVGGAAASGRGRRLVAILGWTALALAVLALGTRAIRTPDAYFHLAVGQTVLEEGAAPRTNRWLAFEPDRPFLTLEWGFQTALAAVYERFGLEGVLGLRLALSALATGCVVWTVLPLGLAWALGAGGGFLLLAHPRFLLAPELFTIASIALCVLALERRRAWGAWLWLLVPLTAIWANAHGFFLVGLGLVTLYALGDAVHDRRWGLVPIALGCAAATLCTPYGWEGALYPFGVAGDAAGRALLATHITELRSPLTDPQLAVTLQARLVKLGAGLAGLAVVSSLRAGFRVERAVALVAGAALGLMYLRNVGVFAAVAAPLVPIVLGPSLGRRATMWIGPLRARAAGSSVVAAVAVALGAAAHGVISERAAPRELEPIGLGARFAPAIDHDRAIGFYLEHRLPRELWCSFGTGHAVIERGGGRLRPAICGQTDLYPRSLLRAYGDALAGTHGGLDALMARWPADAWLLDHTRAEGTDLLTRLLHDEAWTLVYLDPRDAIWLRSTGGTAAKAAALAIDLAAVAADPEAHVRFDVGAVGAPGWVRALRRAGVVGTPPELPRQRVAIARFLLEAGYPDAALSLTRHAGEGGQVWAPALYIRGLAARAVGDLDEAKRALRAAAEELPESAALHGALGLVHLRLRELGRAEEALVRARALAPDDTVHRENLRLVYLLRGDSGRAAALGGTSAPSTPAARRAAATARFNAAVAAAETRDVQAAERLYRSAVDLDPAFADAWYNLGNLLYRRGDREGALSCYDAARSHAPQDAEVRYNRGVVLLEMGRRGEARGAFEETLVIAPGHVRARAALARMESGGER